MTEQLPGSSHGPAGQPVVGPTPATTGGDDGSDKLFQLLQFSYREVLDATKHQDDKISRLLTTVAFLTAAALALAGLHSGAPLAAPYLIDGRFTLPLGLIALGGFLICVTVSVIMLIASTTTPLVWPGRSSSVVPDIHYAQGPRYGQIFFNEIARTALPAWYRKWRDSPEELARERNDSLVRETHNLAVRTEFKYQRSNEAVAVLSFGLLSFLASAILILFASWQLKIANSSTASAVAPLKLNWTIRLILSAVFFTYYLLQVLGTQRSQPPTVLDIAYQDVRVLPLQTWRNLYAVLTALVTPQLLLLPSEPARLRLVLAIGVPVLSWLALYLALPWPSSRVERELETAAKQDLAQYASELPASRPGAGDRARLRRHLIAAGVAAACYLTAGVVAALAPSFREIIGLAATYGAGLLLLVTSIWQIGRSPIARADRYRKDHPQPNPA